MPGSANLFCKQPGQQTSYALCGPSSPQGSCSVSYLQHKSGCRYHRNECQESVPNKTYLQKQAVHCSWPTDCSMSINLIPHPVLKVVVPNTNSLNCVIIQLTFFCLCHATRTLRWLDEINIYCPSDIPFLYRTNNPMQTGINLFFEDPFCFPSNHCCLFRCSQTSVQLISALISS